MSELLKFNNIALISAIIILTMVVYYVIKEQKRKIEKRKIAAYLKGINYAIEDKTDKAIEELTSAIDLEPDLVDVYISIGNLFRKKGEINRALIIHKGLLARKLDTEKKIEVYINIGIDYKKAGLYDRAKETFKNALSLDPKNQTIKKYLEEVYEDSKDWESALIWQKRFGENKKITAHIYCELGKKVLKESNDHKTAFDYFSHALSEDKNCFDAMLNLGILYYNNDNKEKAFQMWFEAVRVKNELFNLVLDKISDSNDLYKFLKQVLIFNPKSHYILLFSAMYLLKLGKDKKALSLLNIILKNNSYPQSAVVLALKCLSKQSNNKKLEMLAFKLQNNIKYTCKSCGYSTHLFFWKCPKCRTWDSAKVEF